MRYLIAEMHRIEREATGQQSPVALPSVGPVLTLATSPYYEDCVDMLLGLRDGELCLPTEARCRRLVREIEGLALEVARADMRRRGAGS